MQTSSETVRLMMRLGYWSVWHGLYTEAAALFSGTQAARPQSEIPIIGMAVLSMAMNRPEYAVQILREQALPLNPQSDLVSAHLGCALRVAGQEDEGLQILRQIAISSTDQNARQMAQNLETKAAEQLKPLLSKIL
ncbi:MAG: hypothetical protein RIQ93_2083 [Verrucomicrobiota bacterium]|jgi:Flp pilus assembly protein TadD